MIVKMPIYAKSKAKGGKNYSHNIGEIKTSNFKPFVKNIIMNKIAITEL